MWLRRWLPFITKVLPDSPWGGYTDRLVGQGGTDHARHRPVSVPAGLQLPWTVHRVNLDVNGQRVDVWAEHSDNAIWACPHCRETLPLDDYAEERTWRLLDSCQFQTYLHARIPRVVCGKHGVVQVLVPWAVPRSRFTLLFERLAIDVLRQCDVTGACGSFGSAGTKPGD